MISATTAVGHPEPELAGQTVVQMGGSSGIGLETAWAASSSCSDTAVEGRYW